jgi:hypothetical protein
MDAFHGFVDGRLLLLCGDDSNVFSRLRDSVFPLTRKGVASLSGRLLKRNDGKRIREREAAAQIRDSAPGVSHAEGVFSGEI